MDTININGTEWVRLHDVCDILRDISENPVFENTDKVMRQIAQLMFYDEVQKAETDEDREAAREFPGDFVVLKDLGYKNPNGKRFIYFMEFSDGEGKAIDSAEKAMVFEYKSMADHVAEVLGEGWRSICVGVESGRIAKRVCENFDKALKAESGEDDRETV